jgi:hypothetical protein
MAQRSAPALASEAAPKLTMTRSRSSSRWDRRQSAFHPRVLDCRQFRMTLISTTKDPAIAARVNCLLGFNGRSTGDTTRPIRCPPLEHCVTRFTGRASTAPASCVADRANAAFELPDAPA